MNNDIILKVSVLLNFITCESRPFKAWAADSLIE